MTIPLGAFSFKPPQEVLEPLDCTALLKELRQSGNEGLCQYLTSVLPPCFLCAEEMWPASAPAAHGMPSLPLRALPLEP